MKPMNKKNITTITVANLNSLYTSFLSPDTDSGPNLRTHLAHLLGTAKQHDTTTC